MIKADPCTLPIDKSIKHRVRNLNQDNKVRLRVDVANELDLIIGYSTEYNFYIVWNNRPHILFDGILRETQETHDYTSSIKYHKLPKILSEFETIHPIYKKLNRAARHEKVVLVKPCFIDQFCEHPFSYLMPDKNDPNFEPDTLYAAPNMAACVFASDLEKNKDFFVEDARKRYNCSRAERDYTFRKRVFAQYSQPHCIVCGITNQTVLQAAHIISVSHANDDTTDNGIVLCANHHLMYDKEELEIDFSSRKITYKPQIKESMVIIDNGDYIIE